MSNWNYCLSLQLQERHAICDFPPPYNLQISPYGEVKDFSKAVRYELIQLKRKFNLKPCKVIFVGDVSVGKTTIVSRFCYEKFQVNYKATIGVDFEIETFNILGHNYNLEIWDTAGQERFKCIAQAYYRNANIIVIVFDMSKSETLQTVTSWLNSTLSVNNIQKPLLFLVGTKSDLLSIEDFQRTEKIAGDIAESIKAEYWSVSARSGYKIVDFFHRMTALAFELAMEEVIFLDRNYIHTKIMDERKNEKRGLSNIFLRPNKKYESNRNICLC